MRPFLYAVLTVSLLALAAPAAWAQGVTTAAISGTVRDAQGGPLPGANVVATHVPSGTTYGAATRLDGRYDLQGLRVGGPYTVRATFIGFSTAERTGLTLALNRTETVEFTLAEGEQLDAVDVTAARADGLISESRTGAATTVGEEALEALPTIGRSLADFARLSPLASASGESTTVGGRNNRYNNIQIDGATLNDVFGLAGSGTPGGQAGTQPISLDAVEAFNIEVAPFDVRQSGFTGGLINAVTRSGTNEFSGTVRYLGRSGALVGTINNTEFGDFSQGIGAFTLGGPILRDRLFFFLSGELSRDRFPDNTGLSGSGSTNESLITGAQAAAVADVARTVYGYDAGSFEGLVTDARDSNKLLAKFDWNIGGGHRASFRYNFVDAADDQGISRSRTSFDLTNRRYLFDSQQHSLAASLFSTFRGGITNEARLVFTAIRDQRAVQASPFPETRVFFGDARVNLGIDRFSQANALDQNLLEFTNDLTLFRGAHTITVGTSNQFYGFDNLFLQDYYGYYEFEDLALGGLTVDTDGDGAGDVSGTLPALDAFRLGLPSVYRFTYASEYTYDGQGRLVVDAAGNPVRTAGYGQPRAAFSAAQLGLYVQDQWAVTPRLRLTAGLRVDLPVVPQSPVENPLVSGTTAVRPDGTTFEIAPAFGSEYSTAETASGNLLFSPRLGFNYSQPALAGRTLQVRGGTGIFSGRTPFVWISNQFSNTGADLARVDAGLTAASFDTNGDGVLSGTELGFFSGSGEPSTHPIPGGGNALTPITTTEINLIAPGFRFPQVWRSNLGIDQELPFGVTATLEGVYSKTLNDVVYRNLNLTEGSRSLYGRPVYNGPRVNPNFTNVLLLDNTSEGYEYSLVAQLQREVREGLGGSLSYTYGRAESVNSATSSRAISNWQFNESVDINGGELGTADFEVRHRVLGFLSYGVEYADRFASRFGLVLDSRSGETISWIYNGDANADGQRANDLIYIPDAETDIFLTSGNWALLDAFIEGQPGLADDRGGFAPRNSDRGPWQTRLDAEFTQSVETVRGQRVDFEVTLVNVLNFLNSEWGRIRGTAFNNLFALDFSRYIAASDVGSVVAGRIVSADDIGKPVVAFNERTARDAFTGARYTTFDLSSRWQLRFGVKYTF